MGCHEYSIEHSLIEDSEVRLRGAAFSYYTRLSREALAELRTGGASPHTRGATGTTQTSRSRPQGICWMCSSPRGRRREVQAKLSLVFYILLALGRSVTGALILRALVRHWVPGCFLSVLYRKQLGRFEKACSNWVRHIDYLCRL